MIIFMSSKQIRNNYTVIIAIAFGLLMALSPMFFLFSPDSGGTSAAVANPAAVTQSYTVSFHESGLPTGTSWSVSFFGTSPSSTSMVNFTNVPSGATQTFLIFPVAVNNHRYEPTPSSGTVYVDNRNVTVSVSFYNQTASLPVSGYDFNFTVTNFPAVMPGISWSWTATISGVSIAYGPVTSSPSANNKIDYFTDLANGTYSYSLSPAYGTSLSPATGQVTINGRNTTLGVSVSLMKDYKLQFNETGLPADQKLSVSVYDAPTGGSHYSKTNDTFVSQHRYVDFFLINQTYDYTINTPSGYSAYPSSGTDTITGSSQNVTLHFSVAREAYHVNFLVTNPPADTPGTSWFWGVTVNGTFYGYSHNDSLTLPGLVSGNYSYITSSYGIALDPMSGTFSVNGTGTTVLLKAVPSWSAAFKITNLADSAFGYPAFDVQVTTNTPGLGGEPVEGSPFQSTGGGVLIPALPNGTYYYTLTSMNNNFNINPASGTFSIHGKNSTLDLNTVAEPVYSAQFNENGLISDSGISWGVVLDNGFYYNDSTPIPPGGLTHVLAPNSMVEELPQGTYWVQAFVIDSGGTYHYMSPVKITVGSGENLFTMQFATGTASGPSLTATDYAVIGGIAAVAIAGVAVLLLWRRRGGTGP